MVLVDLDDDAEVVHGVLLAVEEQVDEVPVPVGVEHARLHVDGTRQVAHGRLDAPELAQYGAAAAVVVGARALAVGDDLVHHRHLVLQQLKAETETAVNSTQ